MSLKRYIVPMTKHLIDSPSTGQRGPSDHATRDAIVAAASEHFRHYGYGKTTVSDLAKAIGYSKAYIYKFFDSKQSIGEAICGTCLAQIVERSEDVLARDLPPSDKLRRLFTEIVDTSIDLFVEDRKLYDVTAHAAVERWSCTEAHKVKILSFIERVVLEGRASGEFEAQTPIKEVSAAIFQAMKPFVLPPMLVHNLDDIKDGLGEVTELVIRSLSLPIAKAVASKPASDE